MRNVGGYLTARGRARRVASAVVAAGTVAGTLLVVAGTSATLGSAPAFADTGSVNYTCPTQIGTFTIPIDVTGTISPSGLVAGSSFSLDNYQVMVTLPPSVAQVLRNNNISSLSGTTGAIVDAANAFPSSLTPSMTWGPVPVPPSGGFSFSIPNTPTTVGPFTASSNNAPPVLSAGPFTTEFFNGAQTSGATCSPPAGAPVIADSLTTTPSATSIVADTPGGLTDTATVSGEAPLGAPTGTASFYWCGPSVSTCSASGNALGSAVGFTAGADDTSSATSAVLPTPSEPGQYCFFASYSGDGNYPATGDGSSGECFVVTPPIPCDPSCSGTVASTAGAVAVAGSSTTAGNLFLSVGQSSLDCGNGYSSPAQFTTIQESDFASTTPLTATDTVLGDPTLKRFGVCFQSFAGPFKNVHGALVHIGLLHKCRGTKYPAPCIESTRESGGNVVAVLLVPPNDPRFHAGGTSPLVTSVSPASGGPNTAVTIRGLFLKGAKVRVGPFAVTAKASASKIVMKLPTSVSAGNFPIIVTTPTGSTVFQNFRIV